MFYYISGKIAHKGDNFLVIDANGVGYKIYTSRESISSVGELGEFGKLYTYLNFKTGAGTDVFDLYGFSTLDELNMFELIIGVSRIGAKTAVNLLSNITPSKFALCVATGDSKYIAKNTPGLGAKGAERIVLELKDKFKNQDLSGISAEEIFTDDAPVSDEALSALMVLGYSKQEAEKAIKGISGSTEDIIKEGLKNLMRG